MTSLLNQDQKTGKIKVSDNFVKAYRLFNVVSIEEVFRLLPRAEKILLYILVVDRHPDFNETSLRNFSLDTEIVNITHQLLTDGPSSIRDSDFLYLCSTTNFDYISIENLVDGRGRQLPKPLIDEREIMVMKRDINIEKILVD
jgi:hypothetical protein